MDIDTGRIALVTGASRGLGRATAIELGTEGATVYITGRNLYGWYASISGDPEGDLSQGTNAGQQYFRQFSAPQTRAVLVGIRSLF